MASNRLVVLDELRVPYDVAGEADQAGGGVDGSFPLSGFGQLRQSDREDAPALRWPSDTSHLTRAPALYSVDGVPFFARLVRDPILSELSVRHGWTAAGDVRDMNDRQVAMIWREPGGSLVLPFDPNDAIRNLTMELYRNSDSESRTRLREAAVRAYYLVRPILPRRLQLAMRRGFSRVQARTQFPRWPFEPARHDFARRIYALVAEITDSPLPWIAPWPRPHTWALVLTHDVETDLGYNKMLDVCALEEVRGYRSSWNFVPRRYHVEERRVEQIGARGFEVGIHGLYHDGRDLESRKIISERLPAIREHADRWGAVGFRSPATQRRWEWMGLLGFDYDSSFPDTDPYEPQPGGSCSWLPFFIEDLVELPITLPQDHTLFVILRRAGPSTWIEKTRQLRDRGGMALVLTHPDYLTDPSILRAYESFLDEFQSDASAWRPLPRDVASWWRRRAASHLEPRGDGWRVVGPAAGEAAIQTNLPT